MVILSALELRDQSGYPQIAARYASQSRTRYIFIALIARNCCPILSCESWQMFLLSHYYITQLIHLFICISCCYKTGVLTEWLKKKYPKKLGQLAQGLEQRI